MRNRPLRLGTACVALAALPLAGCVTSSESAGVQSLTANVGKYGPAPSGVDQPKVGVPAFKTTGSGSSRALDENAADQITTLLFNSDRFRVIERAQLDQLLAEQDLEGIVKEGELARQGEVKGVDYLLIGKVTNLRVKAEQSKRGFGIGRIPIIGTRNSLGAFDFKKKDSTITAECGVDLRLVNPTTGELFAANSSDYKRTDSIGAFGVQVLGVNADADASLEIDEDNKGLLLRLALDNALQKMMPKIDANLRRYHASQASTN